MDSKIPRHLTVTEDYEIGEFLTCDGVTRILLSPSKCYLDDDVVNLEELINEIVKRYNKNNPYRLYQLHHQSKTDRSKTEMIAQNEISNNREMNEWWKEVAERKPPPEGWEWLCCNEESKHFVMAVAEV